MTQQGGTDSILIIGAGISGLLLAQYFRKEGIKFRIFERDADLATRGLGWGLTLHWSLPALRAILPEDLFKKLPDAYVDRVAVEKGLASVFPFYDLKTGERKFESPPAPESHRIRVTRARLRQLLATGINIEWEKALRELEQDDDSVTATFEDGSKASGRLLIACDGSASRVRASLFPENSMFKLPIKVLGLKLKLSPEQATPVTGLDPFFTQGTSSENDTFIYISLLDAPDSNEESTENYVCQLCISWPSRQHFFGNDAPLEIPETREEKLGLIQSFADTWAEPFRTLARSIPEDEEIKSLELQDFPPPLGLRSKGRAVLMGDALHAMVMYRGEGANHCIVDVNDFIDLVGPHLGPDNVFVNVRKALDAYEDAVVARARPGVLASRRACLDAHDWSRINASSPLLTRREMKLKLSDFE
ncbi:FAD binding domain-containing protein [Mariannaea sp. PMI_226]|nr:FAD binding domain-containing protein [Mariannaea sp. PMI_226]